MTCSKTIKAAWLILLAATLLPAAAFAQRAAAIAEVQGSGNISPLEGERVKLTGIVTARTRTGFFLQTPDADADDDPNTSEGIYVYIGPRGDVPAEAAAGNLVTVTGDIQEFRRNSEAFNLTLTELSFNQGGDKITVISKGNPLPKPIIITREHLTSNKVDQLEKFEGMRVSIPSAVTVEPTGGRENNNVVASNGRFAVVLKGTKRPFREPGIDIREFAAVYDTDEIRKTKPVLPVFDSNPEVIRVDTAQQRSADGKPGEPLDIAAMTAVENIVGVLQYEGGRYVIFTDLDTRPVFTTVRKPKAMPKLTDTQFSVAGMNLENFFDDVDDPGIKEPVTPPEVFQKRLNKISRSIRDYLRLPDVIGSIEVENINALKKLAERINSDSVKAGLDDPKYEAFLIEGNDGRGIDCGFLIKRSRVDIVEIIQIGKKDTYEHPETGDELPLNDRPPLMVRVSVKMPDGKEFPLTVIVNHMKSFRGYSDPKNMNNVRLKKRLQAETLARFVSARQKADAAERIILLGDFNAFQFSDGILDLIGTLKGTPAAKEAVLNPSEDLVDPDLVDLVDVISANERYSYVFDANAQTLDHMLISQNLKSHIKGFGFARLNADFPEVLKNDPARPERFSDHDPAIAYFTFR